MNILAFPRAAVAHLLREPICLFEATDLPTGAIFQPRAALEEDPSHLQLIPYAVLRRRDGAVWAYRRTGGDTRLQGQKSVGVGGHVDQSDACGDFLSTAHKALLRELSEELEVPPLSVPKQPLGWIHEQASAVGCVHLGLVWDLTWPEQAADPSPTKGERLSGLGFQTVESITEQNGYERWSELACHLIQEQAWPR